MSKAPAFQFYPQDFLADLNVKLMTTEAVGAYLLLLCHDWIEDGLPDDDDALAVLSGMREHWPNTKEQVLKCFKKRGKKLFNPRLEEERKKQRDYRLKKSAAGKESAKSRKRKKLRKEKDGNTCSTDVPTGVEDVFEQNSTLQSSSSPSVIDPSPARAREESVPEPPVTIPPDFEEIAMRIYGSVPLGNLSEWCRMYPAEWVRKAMAVTERRGKRSVSYTMGILQDWQRQGGPDDDEGGKTGGGKPRRGGPPNQGENLERGAKAFEGL